MVRALPASFCKGRHITAIGLDASTPVPVHRRVIRIGHNDLVAHLL
jgi:hypothetical protein